MKGFTADEEVKEKIQEISKFLTILKERNIKHQIINKKIKVFHGVCIIGEYDINFPNILKETEKHLKICRNY